MNHGIVRRKQQVDFWLSLVIFILIIFGLVMISSASVVMSYEAFGVNNYYFKKQLSSLVFGAAIWIIMQNINYHFWKRFSKMALWVGLAMMAAVFIPGIGFASGGANRWIHVGPLFLQPTEFMKLALVLFLATWFDSRRDSVRKTKFTFVPFLAIIGLISLLVLAQPDMGTLSILMSIALSIYFVAGAARKHLALLFGIGVVGIGLLIKFESYRLARFLVFLDPTSDTQGIGYHINQALIAIGSGGIFGVGFGRSRQKYNYLPEAATDSIFAITAEELGFLRASLIIMLFGYLAWRGYRVARLAPDYYGKLLAVGITSWFAFQAFVNIAAMLSLLPLTGVPLPFVSYGGSNLVVSLAAVGMLLNISKYSQEEGQYEGDSYWWRNWWSHFAGTIGNRFIKRSRRNRSQS